MEILSGNNLNSGHFNNSVVVIGNFDGVHYGHRSLIDEARLLCSQEQKLLILSFEPHPRRLFKPDEQNFQLTNPETKAERLRLSGVDFFVVMDFDLALASMLAMDFLQDILLGRLGATKIVVGQDFCFGKGREGSVAFLQEHAKKLGYEVYPVKQKTTDSGEIISSSLVRNYIRAGEITQANKILGWDWYIKAPVIKGDQRGRELGYPTANQIISPYIYPRFGVYAVRVQFENDLTLYPAVANIGIRPMFKSQTPLLETHIFDFNQDIYGQNIKVFPVHYIRPEARFETLDALIQQMDNDSAKARKILGS